MDLHQAAAAVFDVQMHYAKAGSSLVKAVMSGRPFLKGEHYPRWDMVGGGSRAYFHDHSLALEHGHFHLFLGDMETSHLIGISMCPSGNAIGMFTTNRWVTGDVWRPADEMINRTHEFTLPERGPLAPVMRWLNGMVVLFKDEINELLRIRDAEANRNQDITDNRDVHVLSSMEIDVFAKLPMFLDK